MASINSGVRIGAAAFALGLSLAGPQALGVATADSTDADSPSVSAGPAASPSAGPAAERRAARRAARSAAAAAPATTAFPRAAATTTAANDGPLDVTVQTARAARSAARRLASEAPALPTPTAAQPVGDPARVAAVTPSLADVAVLPAGVSSAKPAAASCGSCWAFGAVGSGGTPVAAKPPTMHQIATVRIAQTLDRLGNWLTGLPATTPFTDFASGALQLVRRTLLPNVPTIPKLTVSNTSVLEPDSGTTDAVFTVTLDKAYDQPVSVGYSTSDLYTEEFKQLIRVLPSHTPIHYVVMAFFALMAESSSEKAMRLAIELARDSVEELLLPGSATPGQDYLPVSGLLTFAPGQTSQQVSVPVLSDTADEPPETFDLNVYPTRLSGTAASAVTGVALARGVGTIISGGNPFGGIVTNADVSYLKLSVTTGVPGEVWRLETPDSFELLGNIHNGAFLGHLTLAAPTDLGRATPVVGSLNAVLQTPCPDGQNGGCQASARTLIANVEGIADPAGFSLDVVGVVRSENEHHNIETDYSYLLLPETTNNPVTSRGVVYGRVGPVGVS